MDEFVPLFLDAGGKLTSAVIFTTENPDAEGLDSKEKMNRRRDLVRFLIENYIVFVPVKACFRLNDGDSYMVFNVGEGSVQGIAGHLGQSSFLYLIPTANGVEAQFWVRQDVTSRYHEVRNPYCMKNQVFECAEADNDGQAFAWILRNLKVQFDKKLFESVSDAIKAPKSWQILTDGVGLGGFAQRVSVNKEAIKIVSELLNTTCLQR